MIREGGIRKRPFEEGRFGLTDELTFPAIPQNRLTNEPIMLEGIIEGNQVRRILVDDGISSKVMYEHCLRNLNVNVWSRLRRCRALMVGFSRETYHPLGVIDLQVTMGRAGRSKTVLMEFAIIKCRSPYNVIIGRTGMRSLRAVGSTINSMIKFPTNQGIVTMETSREALRESRQLERVQGLWKGKNAGRGIRGENMEVFAWFGSERTVVPQFVMEHQLTIYPLVEPVVQHPVWAANTIPIMLANGTWKVQMDYSSLNKVCAKDMYPFSEEGEELASLMGYPYKCFLRLPKEYSQIRMADDNEEKTRMIEKVLADQRGWNVETYLEEIVIKSKSELDLVQGVEETLIRCKRVNIKIDPVTSSFGVKEGKETIEEGLGVGIIMSSPEEKMYSYAIHLKFNASNHAVDCEALLAGLAASVSKCMKDLHVFMDSPKLVAQTEGNHMPATEQERKYKKEIIEAAAPFDRFRITHLPKNLNSKVEVLTGLATIKLEFLNQEVSVGIKTRPLVEETSCSKKGKAATNIPGAKPNYNWEVSRSN
ncbi:reverse transcriptase domain-containing protein [Tanacetum coccineum]